MAERFQPLWKLAHSRPLRFFWEIIAHVQMQMHGARAGKDHFRLLAKPCTTITAYGKHVLSSIRKNKLPTGLSIWPEEETKISAASQMFVT